MTTSYGSGAGAGTRRGERRRPGLLLPARSVQAAATRTRWARLAGSLLLLHGAFTSGASLALLFSHQQTGWFTLALAAVMLRRAASLLTFRERRHQERRRS